jgi:DDE family transposase
MSLPFGNLDTTFESFLQELPEDYRELAIEFKAFTRPRKIKTPAQLMQIVMGYCGIDQVLREAAGNFTLLEERISDTAIHNRLKACVPWVKALLSRILGAAAGPLLEGHLRFLIADGSTVQGPGAKGTWYRLHLAIDLVKLHLVHVVVTDEHEGEHLDHYPLQEGDVVVVDRGYNQAQRWVDHADRGVSLVVRYNPHGLNLYDAAGKKIDFREAFQETTATEQCLPVRVRTQNRAFIEGHLHARRLPPAQAAEARRRARREAKKAGRQIRHRTLALAEWVLIFTTLPPTVLPTATIMALYRVRWQVELVIKRLKSILNIDRLRARKDGLLAELYLHGKLLYAWVVEKRARRRCGEDWNRLDQPRRATPWRVWKLLYQELAVAISGVMRWNLKRWSAGLEVMQERPRRRPLQTLPDRVNRLIAYCQTNGISNI